MNLVEALAEAGALPDAWYRAWIRAEFAAGRTPPPIARAATRGRPPLELPPDFFADWLGPRLKLSCGLWPASSTTLGESEDAMLRLTCERAGLAPGMRVLDLGCGFGALALWIAEHDPTARVVAVSNSRAETAWIRERAPANVVVLLADAGSFNEQGAFDRVFAVELLEHVTDPLATLALARTLLKPDGRLFVQGFPGPAPGAPIARWRVDGREYVRTLEAWLARLPARDVSTVQSRRWRLLLIALAEAFARPGWAVEQALYEPPREAVRLMDS